MGACELKVQTLLSKCVHACSLFSCVHLFTTLWTVACRAPLSMGFSRQEYWSGPMGGSDVEELRGCTIYSGLALQRRSTELVNLQVHWSSLVAQTYCMYYILLGSSMSLTPMGPESRT